MLGLAGGIRALQLAAGRQLIGHRPLKFPGMVLAFFGVQRKVGLWGFWGSWGYWFQSFRVPLLICSLNL